MLLTEASGELLDGQSAPRPVWNGGDLADELIATEDTGVLRMGFCHWIGAVLGVEHEAEVGAASEGPVG